MSNYKETDESCSFIMKIRLSNGDRRGNYMVEDKKILLCVTGGIAVYKAAALNK